MKTKKIRKRFELADYLEKEKFLQMQHKKGWRMVDLKSVFSTYIFEECEPNDYAYQLDFKQQEKDLEEYLQLFEDCGWEHFYKFGNWYYFRKKKSEILEENVIFNDVPTRAEMAKKVVRFQGMVSFVALFPLFYIVLRLLNRSEGISNALLILLSIYGVVMVVFIGSQLRNFWKLNQIIKREEQI